MLLLSYPFPALQVWFSTRNPGVCAWVDRGRPGDRIPANRCCFAIYGSVPRSPCYLSQTFTVLASARRLLAAMFSINTSNLATFLLTLLGQALGPCSSTRQSCWFRDVPSLAATEKAVEGKKVARRGVVMITYRYGREDGLKRDSRNPIGRFTTLMNDGLATWEGRLAGGWGTSSPEPVANGPISTYIPQLGLKSPRTASAQVEDVA